MDKLREEILKPYIYKNIVGFGDAITPDCADEAMIIYASQQTSELKAENTRLWEEMDRYIGATKVALEQAGVIASIKSLALSRSQTLTAISGDEILKLIEDKVNL